MVFLVVSVGWCIDSSETATQQDRWRNRFCKPFLVLNISDGWDEGTSFLWQVSGAIERGMLRVVAPGEQARMAINPKIHTMPIHVQTRRPKSRLPTFNKNSGSAMRRPSARHAEYQRRMTTTITSQQSSEQRIHEALNHRLEDRTSN